MPRSLRFLSCLLFVSLAVPIALSAEENLYDLVIYGGTAGGVAAAVQARRMGKTAVLIEPGKHLGGLTSGGLGATDIGNKAAIGGISREFYQRIKKHYADPANWKHEKPEQLPLGPRQRAGPGRRDVDVRAARRRADLSTSSAARPASSSSKASGWT